MQIWAHRGAMAHAPQNTLPSFRLAEEAGADGVELDVQLTRDGVPVVFHDAHVDALTDGRGPLASLAWSEVARLDAGSSFGRSWAGTRVPTLEAVLAAVSPHLLINVELKTALSEETWRDRVRLWLTGPREVDAGHEAVARAEAEALVTALTPLLAPQSASRIVLSSFDPWALEAAAQAWPHLPRGFLHSPTVPWKTPQRMTNQEYQAWHPHFSQVNASTVAAHHEQGRRVHVWTVNEAKRARWLRDRGVDAVITNRPEEIRVGLG